ncbi:hypothetical protein BBJ28_00002925 [Nothophytophthora sp. Chile5]|nr:hypothetical protein BBJ28_00002925 [Nothophytophthora sp. Chile5]
MEKRVSTGTLNSSSGLDRSGTKLFENYRVSEPILVESESSGASDTAAPPPVQASASPVPWMPGSPQHLTKRKLKLPVRNGKAKTCAKLPRMDEVIPRVELTDAQQLEMRTQAETLIASCLLKSQAAWDGTKQIFDDPKQWKLHSAKPHLAVYKRRDPTHHSSATAQQFVATGRIPGLTLQDVEYGKYSDTTLDERSTSAYLYRDYFLDAAVLQAVDTQSESDPFRFFGIKWMAFASPGGPARFFSPRDHAYYEYAKTVTTEAGHKVLVKVVHSVEDDVVPPLTQLPDAEGPVNGLDPARLRFVRGRIAMTSMYRFDRATNAVQVFAEGSLDPGGRASNWLGSAFLSQFAPTVVRIEYCADIKYIMKHGMIFPHPPAPPSQSQSAQSLVKSQSTVSGSEATAQGPAGVLAASALGFPSITIAPESSRMAVDTRPSWVPDHQRKVCFVCFKSFGIVRRHRHHCRMCGEVMCSRCMITLPLVAPPTSAPPQQDGDDGEEGGAMGNNGAVEQPQRRRHRRRHQQRSEPHMSTMLQQQPAKKSLEETRPNGYPAVNAVKLCKKCMFSIRQERKGTMYGSSHFYVASTMLQQFPLVVPGVVASGVGVRPGPTRGFLPGGRYAADDELNNNNMAGKDEDDVEETDEQYSARIEHMRQMHMAREKQKNLRRSIRLYDEEDPQLQSGESSPAARPPPSLSGDDGAFNFDDLLLPTPKPGEEDGGFMLLSDRGRGKSAAAQSQVPRRASTATRPVEEDAKLRSLSIPDQLEQMERSIAQQEALIRSIAEERSKLLLSPDGDTTAARTTAATTAGELSSEARSSWLYPGSTQTAPTPRADVPFTPVSMRST